MYQAGHNALSLPTDDSRFTTHKLNGKRSEGYNTHKHALIHRETQTGEATSFIDDLNFSDSIGVHGNNHVLVRVKHCL